MAHDVFISYSAEDKPIADAVCAALEAKHTRCWIAPRDVLPGRDYAEELIEAIRSAALMLLVFSSHSNSSPHVMREVERAASRGIPILPFRVEDVPPSAPMEYYISSTHWLDALTPPLERHLNHLVETVQLLLERSGRTTAATVKPEARASSSQLSAAEEDAKAKAPSPEAADGSAKPWFRRRAALLGMGATVLAAIVAIVVVATLYGGAERGVADGNTSTTSATVPPSTTATAAWTATVEVAWKVDSGAGGSPSPVLSDGVAYWGGIDHRLYAVDDETGQAKWKFQTGGAVRSSPAITYGVVYFGSDDTFLYALDAETGQEKWRFEGGGEMMSPVVSDRVVYCGNVDHRLYAVDAESGQAKWKFQTGGAVRSSPAMSDGVVYFGSDDTFLYALDAGTGQEKWRFEGAGEMMSPAISDGVAYCGNVDHRLYAVDAETGQAKWKFQPGGAVRSSPAITDGVVYFGSDDGYVYALVAPTGPAAATSAPALASWANLDPPGNVPSARNAHSMVYDSDSGKVILFGGWDGTVCHNDTWAYDVAANTWSELTPEDDVPPVRGWASMVYESGADTVVLFGGWDRTVCRNDTWAFDMNENTWTKLLEVACGSGTFLRKRAAHVHYIAGLDHSDIQLKMARKRNRERIAAGAAEIVKGDSAALPWEDDRFSAVTCNCLGCFAQPPESLKEMHRVLRVGGRAVLSIDYYPTEEKARKAEAWWGLPTWTEAEVHSMIEAAGFSQLSVSHNKRTLFVKAAKQ